MATLVDCSCSKLACFVTTIKSR